MKMKDYKKRVADQILLDKLESSGAVLIEGPKYCGKTTLASQQAGSVLSMADPERLMENPIESGPPFPHIADPR